MDDKDENKSPEKTDETDTTTSSPSSGEVFEKAIAELKEENKRILSAMESLRKSYEESFNRQPASSSEHDEFDDVCQKILKGER